MVTVVCPRWLDAFPVSYINVLREAVRANLNREHRFICVTDNPGAITGDVEAVRMPEMGLSLERKRRGCWPKLSIFAPGLLPPDDPTLYLDLDIIIRGSLDPFFERIETLKGFHALREWNPTLWNVLPLGLRPDRGVQGSILGFIPREQSHLFQNFMDDQDKFCTDYESDQHYLTYETNNRTYWPAEWTSSFKWHCCNYYPLNKVMPKIKEPKKAKIVVFHGNPRPVDIVAKGNYRWGTRRKFGFGPVDWVRDYWLKHDKSWSDEPVAEAAKKEAA